MGNQTGSRRRPAGTAFTLIELLLTVTLLLLLAAAAVVNFDSFQRGAQLDEGATLMESLFRYTRAQSASSGRTLRIVFEDRSASAVSGTNRPTLQAEGIQVLWESDPLTAPGQFGIMREAASFTDRLNELVEVRRIRSMASLIETNMNRSVAPLSITMNESGINAIPVADATAAGAERPPIVFYPDGSSDSVEVLLVSRDPEDKRQLVVTLSGVVGTTRRKWITVDANGVAEAEPEPEARSGEDKP